MITSSSLLSLQAKIQKYEDFKNNPSLWNRAKSEWINLVDDLYSKIIKDYDYLIKEGLIKYEFQQIELEESFIGRYAINSLLLFFADMKIIFEPIQRFMVGGHGKIDLHSDINYFDRYHIILNIDHLPSNNYTWTLYNYRKDKIGEFSKEENRFDLLDNIFEGWITKNGQYFGEMYKMEE